MSTIPTTQPPAVLSATQRELIIRILTREADELDKAATERDRAMTERWPASVVIEADDQEYDAEGTAVERAYDAAEAVDTVRRVVEDARIIPLRPVPVADPVAVIASALVSTWLDGHDVGEVLVQAVAEAQRAVFTATEESLTCNRPGSWEASLVDSILDSSGWDR